MSINEYELSINLIKEAEILIKESQVLLNDISKIRGHKEYDKEVNALRDKILRLELQNNCLYMENVFLKSKIKEFSNAQENPCSYRSVLLDYKEK